MNYQRYKYDKESDALFIYLKEGEEESFEEIAPGINIEFNKKQEIIGIEILKASRFFQKEKKHPALKSL